MVRLNKHERWMGGAEREGLVRELDEGFRCCWEVILEFEKIGIYWIGFSDPIYRNYFVSSVHTEVETAVDQRAFARRSTSACLDREQLAG
jgi:hypothetical protein